MKRIAFLVSLFLAAGVSAQVKMKVLVNGKDAGTASITQHLQPDGTKVVELAMHLGQGDKAVDLRTFASYDRAGAPTRKYQDMRIGAHDRKQTTASFDRAGANVVTEISGARTKKDIPLVDNAPRTDASEYWFIRDHPAKGNTQRNYTFNMDTLEWEVVTTTYVGPKKITVNGHVVDTHELRSERGSRILSVFVDSKGLPYLLQEQQLKMIRIFED